MRPVTTAAARGALAIALALLALASACDLVSPGSVDQALDAAGSGSYWKRIADQPFGREEPEIVVYEGQAYAFSYWSNGFAGGDGKDSGVFAAFDPAAKAWTTLASAEVGDYWPGTLLAYDGTIYTHWEDANKTWAYDIASNAWSASDFALEIGHGTGSDWWMIGFTYGTKAYIRLGDYAEPIRAYDFTDTAAGWSTGTTNPVNVSLGRPVTLVVGSTAYVLGGRDNDMTDDPRHDVQAYDIVADSWSVKASLPLESGDYVFDAFSIGDGAIYALSQKNVTTMGFEITTLATGLWKYDISADQWTRLASYDARAWIYGVFAIGGTGYLVTAGGTYEFVPAP